MKKTDVLLSGLLAMNMVQPALAHDDAGNPCVMGTHSHVQGEVTTHHAGGHERIMNGSFLVKKEMDGFTASFQIIKTKRGVHAGGAYKLMVKVEKDGKILHDIAVNSKVMHPMDKSESKMLMKQGDWFVAAYDLDHAGPHQLKILFKTSDGQKHFVSVNYPQEQQK